MRWGLGQFPITGSFHENTSTCPSSFWDTPFQWAVWHLLFDGFSWLVSLALCLLAAVEQPIKIERQIISPEFYFFFFFFCICDHYCVYLSNSLINLLLLLEKSISLDACKWCMGNNRSIVELTDIWELICGCRSTLCTWVTFQKVKCLCHPFTLTYFDKSPAGYKHSYTPKMIYNCFPP